MAWQKCDVENKQELYYVLKKHIFLVMLSQEIIRITGNFGEHVQKVTGFYKLLMKFKMCDQIHLNTSKVPVFDLFSIAICI